MKFKPHDYQRHAITYIQEKPVAALFLSMGLGKTIITLTALNTMMREQFTVVRPLVVAPLRVARDTWPEELTKWDHLQDLTMSVMVGDAKQRRTALHADADIWVINRENLPWLVKELAGEWPFDTVIIDELSSFKSHSSQRFKALKAVRPHIRRIIGLTGTPAPNSLLDLWAPFRRREEVRIQHDPDGTETDWVPEIPKHLLDRDWTVRKRAELNALDDMILDDDE